MGRVSSWVCYGLRQTSLSHGELGLDWVCSSFDPRQRDALALCSPNNTV